MIKYTTTQVTFREIPDEITLCINISNCPIHCPNCHSKELWNDIGEELTEEKLCSLIEENEGITCICFMGGDNDVQGIIHLAYRMKLLYENLKIAWYSGRNKIYNIFDYVKIGPYKQECGGLDHPHTNQRLFRSNFSETNNDAFWFWEDITYKFWKNEKI